MTTVLMRRLFFVILILFGCVGVIFSEESELRQWLIKMANNDVMRPMAAFIAVKTITTTNGTKPGGVLLKLMNGREVGYPWKLLSDADHKFVENEVARRKAEYRKTWTKDAIAKDDPNYPIYQQRSDAAKSRYNDYIEFHNVNPESLRLVLRMVSNWENDLYDREETETIVFFFADDKVRPDVMKLMGHDIGGDLLYQHPITKTYLSLNRIFFLHVKEMLRMEKAEPGLLESMRKFIQKSDQEYERLNSQWNSK